MARSRINRAGAAQPRPPVNISLLPLDKEVYAAIGLGASSYRELAEASVRTALANQFLDETQLAQRWNVSVKLLQKWRGNGGGPVFTTFGSAVRYNFLDVLSFEQGQRHTSTSDR